MEPERQIEIQLGHMCNNRCVFCVSGQRTEMREAFPLEAEPIEAQLRTAHADGIRKITFLGGEPTLQPEFLRVLKLAVDLGFDEIVIFTNGVKTARAEYVDEVLAMGGKITWRLSFQGGNALAHERTTRKLGSYARLVQTLHHLRDRQQRITVNMCVVQTNHASVADFPALLVPFGVRQLHLDMMRPLDAGIRTEEELRATIPRYRELAEPLERMLAGFPEGFDVNIGNLPYCVAPQLAPWIHHDGEHTLTIAVDDDDTLSAPWNKYEVKRRDKIKPPSCRNCVFDAKCNGIFETYAGFYGTDEFKPVSHAQWVALDPARRLFTLHVRPLVHALESDPTRVAPFRLASMHENSRDGEVVLAFAGERASAPTIRIGVRRPGAGVAGTDRFSLHVYEGHASGEALLALLRAILALGEQTLGARTVHPVAADAFAQAVPRGSVASDVIDWRIAACLARLRARAPFGSLHWRDVALHDRGSRAVVSLDDPAGIGIEFTIAVRNGTVASGYRLDRHVDAPDPRLVRDVRAVFDALRVR